MKLIGLFSLKVHCNGQIMRKTLGDLGIPQLGGGRIPLATLLTTIELKKSIALFI